MQKVTVDFQLEERVNVESLDHRFAGNVRGIWIEKDAPTKYLVRSQDNTGRVNDDWFTASELGAGA